MKTTEMSFVIERYECNECGKGHDYDTGEIAFCPHCGLKIARWHDEEEMIAHPSLTDAERNPTLQQEFGVRSKLL